MGSAVDRLLQLQNEKDPYGIAPDDLLPLQLEAANERLSSRVDDIPLLRNRAQAGGITKVAELADLVPLLFAHSAYKSYSESWLTEGPDPENWSTICESRSSVGAGGSIASRSPHSPAPRRQTVFRSN